MFDVLIREATARFQLGEKATALLQLLLAVMTNKETGGLAGFLEPFKAAGLGPVIQSWLGGGAAARPIGNSQLEAVLGQTGGLLASASERLELPRDHVTSALGYYLPHVVGRLTPGGSMPSHVPADLIAWAEAGQALLQAPLPTSATATGGGARTWLPWGVLGAVVLVGLGYCSKTPAPAPALTAPAASAPAAAASMPAPVAPAVPASEVAAPAASAASSAG